MQEITLAISPILTALVVNVIKMMPTYTSLIDEERPSLIRLTAVIVSFVIVILNTWISGRIDGGALGLAVQTLLVSLSSIGVYHVTNNK